jgi:hypothetical protein
MSAAYSYSSESDYWAHLITVGTSVDLWQRNTTLALTMSYGLDTVAQRMGPTLFNPLDGAGLQTFRVIATYSQVLTRTLLGELSYDLGVLGFGSAKGTLSGEPNNHTGYLNNPYRMVNLGGAPAREQVPFQRIRQSASITAHWFLPTGSRTVPYVAFRPSYRFYWDDWSVYSSAVELRTHLPVGPVELRATGRYYTQTQASFWNEVNGLPLYNDNQGKPCDHCISSSARGRGFYTNDPKLGAFDSFFFELRLMLRLSAFRIYPQVPLARWLASGLIELSYGHYFNDRYAHTAYGDAEVAGLTFSFPL